MAKISLLTRLLKKKALGKVLLALLLVVTAVAVVVAFRPVEPPPPSIDLAAIKARDEAKAAEKAAAAEAERVAGLLPVAFPADRPLRVMLSGDSLSYGLYSTTEATAFRSLVKAEIEKHGPVEWSGSHMSGAKVADISGRPSPAMDNDLSIIELGTNDSFKLVPLDTFAAQYGEYMDRIKSESPNVQFLCLGAWNAPTAINISYEDAIKTTCEQRGGKFLPIMELHQRGDTKGPADVQTWAGISDSGHPNDTGHRMIADAILARLPQLTGL